ncbi:MAG TPA: LLM class flavin-dependent oxidoreductase [Pseudolysinimonas sp.]|jgi:G6PDH family F420-dependent oxidoreductase|nr:LLM class flavin-dependent oxidoreductase [Pseudolysinimonas sp.]
MTIGFHVSHEQFGPEHGIRLAVDAQQAGFDFIGSSDHLAPWTPRTGVCAGSWPWLGAAMARTDLPFTIVTTSVNRYPAVILAQNAATLASLYPGRFDLTLGSGEAVNEAVVGGWRAKPDRDAQLRTTAGEIERMLTGAPADPSRPAARHYLDPADVEVSIAAVTPATAEWVGTWHPRLTTVADTPDRTRERVDRFRQTLGARGHVTLKAQLAYSETRESALAEAHAEWRHSALQPEQLRELPDPQAFADAAEGVGAADLEESIPPIRSASEFDDWLSSFAELDADRILVHNVTPRQEQFIEVFAASR